MARVRRRGEAGAAKAYMTRTAAVKKLQCSLADFRRLCILKGIFPREPRSRKKANKGSSAPTSFYYAKDIAYLGHEPVLAKLREHKAFAKRFARALGRGEWSSAKSLEDGKPVYRIDHIIKERYPSFVDAVRDIDDALCMIFLFASLPSSSRIPPSLVASCAKLAAEWQLYVIKSHCLRKVFLSIKGIYYQADVMDERVTWLVPYMFTQTLPVDVDVRVMMTFLELYQTLLGFVMFKLYADVGLVYPPSLNVEQDEAGASLGAFTLEEAKDAANSEIFGGTMLADIPDIPVKQKSVKEVQAMIRSIGSDRAVEPDAHPAESADSRGILEDDDDQFVVQPSKAVDGQAMADLPTLRSIAIASTDPRKLLFAPYTFFLSRETPRALFEFMVRSFGGRIGWPDSQGQGSPLQEDDDAITHVIIDRPPIESSTSETAEQRIRRSRRKYVQPQWVVDSINAGRILVEDYYAQGKMLPPHLSPFEDQAGTYEHLSSYQNAEGSSSVIQPHDVASESSEDDDEELSEDAAGSEHLLKGAMDDAGLLRAAELAAESRGVDAVTFDKDLARLQGKKNKLERRSSQGKEELEMNKMLMSNKQRKLYNKLKFTETKRANEKSLLERKRKQVSKRKGD